MYETKKEALLMNKPLLSAREASNLIGCSISTLDKYEQERLLVPIMRVGVKRYYSEGQVDDFIVDCCRGSNVSFESNLTFLTATDVRRKLSISVTMLNELEKQDILSLLDYP